MGRADLCKIPRIFRGGLPLRDSLSMLRFRQRLWLDGRILHFDDRTREATFGVAKARVVLARATDVSGGDRCGDIRIGLEIPSVSEVRGRFRRLDVSVPPGSVRP